MDFQQNPDKETATHTSLHWWHKQPNRRRHIAKDKKTHRQCQHQQPEQPFQGEQPAGQSKPVYAQETKQDRQHKGCDVKEHEIFPQDAGVSIEQNRNQESAKQDATKQGRAYTGVLVF